MEFQLLGPFTVSEDGRSVALGGPKQRAVLAMLALEPGRVVSRDRLIDGIWGEEAGATSVATLQVYISMLRKAIEPDPGTHSRLLARAPGYVLQVEPDDVDAARFERWVTLGRKLLVDERFEAAARGLASALELWRGPVLADLPGPDFAGPEIARLDELRLAATEDWAEAELACGRHIGLAGQLEALVTAHPYRERLWGQLMVALYRSGLQAESLTAYGRARRILVDEFGIDPSPALRELERRILVQDATLAPPPGAPRATVKLPAPAHAVVGRQDDLAAVVATLGTDARLVTVTGPGGMGKTSLALEAAAEVVDAYPGGLYFVPLAGVTDEDQVLATVAEVLEVSPNADEPLPTTIAVSLGTRPALLVLDNMEQVLGAGPAIIDLLGRVRTLSVLVTSRAPLRVRGEREVQLGSLGLAAPVNPADPATALSAATALQAPAVALFDARAREVQPGWVLDDGTAGTVAEICRRLDGLPLAIELAAARISLLDADALLARLDRQLGLLTSGPRDLPDRQRTLRSTLDWSYGLLSAQEQVLLGRLGAVTGELSLELAAALAGELDVIDGLSALVDNNLVRRLPRVGGARYRLLETVREYAAERLAESGAEEEVRLRLASALLAALEEDAGSVDGPQAPVVMARVEADYADLRASIDWCLLHDQAQLAGRIVVALRAFWLSRGRLDEGRVVPDRVLAALPADDPLRARLLLSAGIFAYFQDDADAVRILEHAREASRDAPEVRGVVLAYLGAVVLGRGDADEAQALAAAARDLAEQTDSYEAQVLALSLSAVIAASRGELDAERELYARRLDVVRRRGDRRRIAETLNNLAELALAEGEVTAARTYADEALELGREVARIVTRDVQLTQGRIAMAEGDTERARSALGDGVRLTAELGQEFELAQCLVALAGLAGLVEDHQLAARLYGCAARLRGGSAPLDVELEPDVAARRERTRAELGEAGYASAHAHGAAMDRDAALALALGGGQPIR